jgi:hypothetical protein
MTDFCDYPDYDDSVPPRVSQPINPFLQITARNLILILKIPLL